MKLDICSHDPCCQADPFVFRSGTMLYLVCTGRNGVRLFRAPRLDARWDDLGIVYTREGRSNFWAPCVLCDGGKFYLYVSSKPVGADEHEEQIEVAVADAPERGFSFLGQLLPPFSIDPHVVASGDGLFIFYSVNDTTAERAGTYIVVRRMASPTETAGEPVVAVRPTNDGEIFERDRFLRGQHWHTIEGACYFRIGDDHYLMYSGGNYKNDTYFLGYASAHAHEDDLTKIRFRKMPSDDVFAPLLCKNAFESGTGHNSVIEADGALWCVYHGWDLPREPSAADPRNARCCRLVAKDGVLTAIR